jgi:hypothetical protein
MLTRVTFALDEETVRAIRAMAERKQKPQSHVVREAIAAYAQQETKLTDQERARKLDVLDSLLARPRTRPQAAVDVELKGIRRARGAGWRRPSD